MPIRSDDNIPLKVLICDANEGPAAALEQAIKRTSAVLGVRIVHTLDEARTRLRDSDTNAIFIDPLSFNLDEASAFIFSTRRSLPEIVFVLYVDKTAAEQQRVDFYYGERRRFSHYYELDKQTPISSFDAELAATLNLCRHDLSFRLSAASLERLKTEAARLGKMEMAGAERELVSRIEAVLARIAPAAEDRPPAGRKKKVFLSYRFAEKDYIEGLTKLLLKSGFEVITGHTANTFISRAIIERIRECDYFLCLMTQSAKKDDGTYMTSTWLLEEKGAALALGKPIVLMVEEGVTDIGGLQGDWQRLNFGSKGFLNSALQAVEQLNSYAGESRL
jgi:hypothetical protein